MHALHAAALDVSAHDDSARLYRLIADTIPHMVWTARADGSVDYCNWRCHEYTGLDSAHLAGWSWQAVVHPDDWQCCLATWTRCLQSGERYEIEYRLRRHDGVYRWHHGVAVPTRGVEGRVARWFGTCTDIEDQFHSAQMLEAMVQQRARALQDTERRLKGIIDNEPECVKLLDGEGRLLEMNAAGLRMIEADAIAPLLGQCVYPLVAEAHRAAFRELNERVCRGERGTLEFEMVGLKGTRRWLETHAAPFEDVASGRTCLLGITRDVTERRRAEQALRESEQRFQLFMDHLPAHAWIRNGDGHYLFANQQYAATSRVDASQMVGRHLSEFFPAAMAARFLEKDRQVLDTCAAVQFIDDLPEGHWLKVKFPLPWLDGRTAVAGIAVDITERVQAERLAQLYAGRIREMVGRLIDTQELERRRLSDDLHDLIGQNLTALGIELAALRSTLSAESAVKASSRFEAMAGLLNDTIESIRGVMTELRPPALEEYGLVPALRWYAGVFEQRTGMKVRADVLHASPRLPREMELALFRIVQEALTNAAKHSGGSAVEVAVTESAGMVRVVIQDDGRGFVDPVGARSAGRGGWGLPTMRERAEAQGGWLRIEFPGRGTRLVVEMPGRDGH
ncbi:MAG: sensor histidine kinase [Betaproteobacteria bacterium]